MTIADAIIEFEKQLHSAVVVLDSGFGSHPGENDRVYRKRKELAEIALQALRAQQEAENNKPLALAELREMDGEPVWIVPSEKEPDWIPHWEVMQDGYVCANSVAKRGKTYFYYHDNYGEKWLAYRHKPKEK